ncbi:hypothetical protein ElyMa_005742000 [Elysia marginata]|uniref:Uncharacterized protein n=1 Tax=Elysia marginata TaxID=1093978 RepID=A0AAV4FKW1_9GAST|nr:hypothetical protein ElyMa_005742000 [Elysia marginata]
MSNKDALQTDRNSRIYKKKNNKSYLMLAFKEDMVVSRSSVILVGKVNGPSGRERRRKSWTVIIVEMTGRELARRLRQLWKEKHGVPWHPASLQIRNPDDDNDDDDDDK